MRHFLNSLGVFIIVLAIVGCTHFKKYPGEENILNRNQEFDLGWKFVRDSIPGAEFVAYIDSGWRTLDLPHDWSIENLPAIPGDTVIGPFSKHSVGAASTGYVKGGTGWYRKSFSLAQEDTNKIICLHFDGVYMQSRIWVNGQEAGSHEYGYTPFYFDITAFLNKPGQNNLVAVEVKNTGRNSRWYSGSGIYRHVWLSKTNQLRIVPWGISIQTSNELTNKAQVELGIKIKNTGDQSGKFKILTTLLNAKGQEISQVESKDTVAGSSDLVISQKLTLTNPELWSMENPCLYRARVDVIKNNSIIDRQWVSFGVRSIDFSAEKGFLLNGKSVKLKGACIHHDNGLLGSATFDRAEERKLEILKANGFNAIRTSHNPPSKQFLDVCDRLGMLVIDEAFDMWEIPKNPNDYSRFFKEHSKADIESMVLRDRNHPSIFCWSIGNEINERADTSGVRIARELKGYIIAIDSTRPVTAAICHFWDHPGRGWDLSEPAFKSLDIGGYNYQWVQYMPDHSKYPGRIMMGTESVAKEAFENWKQVKEHSWVIGDFVWTGMDYLGETGIGHVFYSDKKQGFQLMPWPWYDSWCGDIDICGFKKPQSYYRDVVWGQSKLEIAVHTPVAATIPEGTSFWGWPDEEPSWTWPGNEGKMMRVNVYTVGDKAQLFLNDKLIAEKTIADSSKLTAAFEVPYEPGNLKAVCFLKGKEIVSKILTTAGKVASIKLTAERPQIKANRNDLAYVIVEAIDDKGNTVSNSNLSVKASVTGEGELLASGNASPNDMQSFRNPSFKLFKGRGLVIIRPTTKAGSIELKVEAGNIHAATLSIISR